MFTATQSCSTHKQSLLWPSQRQCRHRKQHAAKIGVRAFPAEDQDLRQLLGQSYLRPEYEDYTDEHVSSTDWVVHRDNSSSNSSSSSSSKLVPSPTLGSAGVPYTQVNDLVEAAAGLISVIDDLRPLDVDTFNAFYEIYKAIAAVPPPDRYVDVNNITLHS